MFDKMLRSPRIKDATLTANKFTHGPENTPAPHRTYCMRITIISRTISNIQFLYLFRK